MDFVLTTSLLTKFDPYSSQYSHQIFQTTFMYFNTYQSAHIKWGRNMSRVKATYERSSTYTHKNAGTCTNVNDL